MALRLAIGITYTFMRYLLRTFLCILSIKTYSISINSNSKRKLSFARVEKVYN